MLVYSDNLLTRVLTSVWLNTTADWWVAELVDFNFKVKYGPGKSNVEADALPRIPLDMGKIYDEQRCC